MDDALSRTPAVQVATVKEYLAILEEMEEILQRHRIDEEKVAALQALPPRMQAVGIGLQNISSHRTDTTPAASAARPLPRTQGQEKPAPSV